MRNLISLVNKNGRYGKKLIRLVLILMTVIPTMVACGQTPITVLNSGQEISITSNYISYRHWDGQREDYVNDEEYLEVTNMVLQDDAFYIQWDGDTKITKQWWVFDDRRQWSCLDCFLLEPVGEERPNSVCLDYCDDIIVIYYDHNILSDGTGRWMKAIYLTRLDVSLREE